MRTGRLKAEGEGFYHCISRVVDRRMALGESEKEMFRIMMRRVADFCGVQVLTYAALDNHWHILVQVPEREDISDAELLRRLKLLYPKGIVAEVASELAAARKEGPDGAAKVEELRQRYLYRMYDVSQFMKALKQRFSMWYNRKMKRKGTLWEERFKSILVEGGKGRSVQTSALAMVGAYIDLNAVRAGIVRDPKEYRYCGYGEAMGGGSEAREGLRRMARAMNVKGNWVHVAAEYRTFLFESGQQKTSSRTGELKGGFTVEQVVKVVEEGGQLPRAEALRCRVRYFTDGAVLGSKEFVDEVYGRFRDRFGAKRQTGARPMRWSDWGGLCTLRDLRMQVVSVSTS